MMSLEKTLATYTDFLHSETVSNKNNEITIKYVYVKEAHVYIC